MSEKKQNGVAAFFKRNLYYLIVGFSLLVIAAVIAVVVWQKNNQPIQTGGKPESIAESTREPESTGGSDKPTDKPEDPDDKPNQDDPADTKIMFILPVENGSVLKSFTSSTVVFNSTLGVYTGHMGIDFAADEGAEVRCVYDGKIESITTSYLQGTTITVDHGNGLKSVYNSIEAKEGLTEGQSLKKGDVIGGVSTTNRQEYKDGPHLHFETTLNGKKGDPLTYLMLEDK